MRTITAAMLAAAVTFIATTHAAPAAAPVAAPAPVAAQAHRPPAWTKTPCRHEDGPGPCYWDAGRRGNHRGHSYWITRAGVVHYLDGTTFTLDR